MTTQAQIDLEDALLADETVSRDIKDGIADQRRERAKSEAFQARMLRAPQDVPLYSAGDPLPARGE